MDISDILQLDASRINEIKPATLIVIADVSSSKSFGTPIRQMLSRVLYYKYIITNSRNNIYPCNPLKKQFVIPKLTPILTHYNQKLYPDELKNAYIELKKEDDDFKFHGILIVKQKEKATKKKPEQIEGTLYSTSGKFIGKYTARGIAEIAENFFYSNPEYVSECTKADVAMFIQDILNRINDEKGIPVFISENESMSGINLRTDEDIYPFVCIREGNYLSKILKEAVLEEKIFFVDIENIRGSQNTTIFSKYGRDVVQNIAIIRNRQITCSNIDLTNIDHTKNIPDFIKGRIVEYANAYEKLPPIA